MMMNSCLRSGLLDDYKDQDPASLTLEADVANSHQPSEPSSVDLMICVNSETCQSEQRNRVLLPLPETGPLQLLAAEQTYSIGS